MTMLVVYDVIEHYPDDPPEAFGDYFHPAEQPLHVGDVITLRWLDGRQAYPVRIELIRDGRLHVMACETPKPLSAQEAGRSGT
jgi:hypothetical protein